MVCDAHPVRLHAVSRWSEDRVDRVEWQLDQIRKALFALVAIVVLLLVLAVAGGMLNTSA